MAFELPQMFRPTGFPSSLAFEYTNENFMTPSHLSTVPMQTNANVINSTFDKTMAKWKLPAPDIYDEMDDVAESAGSLVEIVQRIFMSPRSVDCQQFEFFFTSDPVHSYRSAHSHPRLMPSDVTTVNEFSRKVGTTDIPSLITKYNPMGFFFTHVVCSSENHRGFLAAYTCGSLCDVYNVWRVPLFPGIRLFFVLAETIKSGKKMIAFASSSPPSKDALFLAQIKGNYAVIDIGTVCVNSNRPPLQDHGNYLKDNDVPQSVHDIPPHLAYPGNILRVNVGVLRWSLNYHP